MCNGFKKKQVVKGVFCCNINVFFGNLKLNCIYIFVFFFLEEKINEIW